MLSTAMTDAEHEAEWRALEDERANTGYVPGQTRGYNWDQIWRSRVFYGDVHNRSTRRRAGKVPFQSPRKKR